MNTLFKLRKTAMVVVAGLAAVFMVAGCKGDDGDGVGGGNTSSTASLTGVSIKGTSAIAADGTGELTATPTYTGEITPQITYIWDINDKNSAEIVGTGSKVTIKGKNTTTKNQSVKVTVTATCNGTTKTDTYTVTVAAKGASVENEITDLELVPPVSSVACDGQVTLTPKVTYTGNLTESDFTVTWEITEGSDYAELVDPSTKARGELTFTGGYTRILQAKNTTNSEQTVTVSVTVSADGKPLTETCTVTVGAASTTENKTWVWNPSNATAVAAVSSDTASADSEHNTTVTLINGAAITQSSVTDSEGTAYSNALNFSGTGSTTSKAVKFVVDGACKISVVARSGGSSERTLKLTDGSKDLTTFSAVSNSTTPSPQSYEYTGGSGSLYLFSARSGINVYLIKIVYGSSSSSSVTTVTISGSQSVAIDGSVTLTATPNATPTGTYKWQVTEGAAFVTLGTSTTNKVTVTGKAVGTAKITASVDDVTSAPYTLTVREAGTNVISLTDAPTGYAGTGKLSYKTSGVTPVTINASDSDAIGKLKNAVKNGNAIVYINGMIDATANSTYGGSMLPSSYTDSSESSPLGKFIAAKTNNAYKSWDAWRLAYAAACDPTSHYTTGKYKDKNTLETGTNNSTLDDYQTKLANDWKSQIQIPVGSNTTIIGVTDESGIKGGNISISDASNIIIRNLHLQDAFDPFPHHEFNDGWNAEYDCITVQKQNDHIWIDHCTFEDTISVGWAKFAGVKTGTKESAIRAYPCNEGGMATTTGYEMWQTYDGLCDIKGKTTNVTVSYCVFKNHDKTMLLGSDDNEKYDNVVLDHTAKTITLHHNYFNGCVQRLPFVRTAHIHIYNNYFTHAGTNGYDQKASIQIRAKAWVISEKNNFGSGISYRYKGDSATESKGYLSDTKLYDANNVGVSKAATEKWTAVTTKPFDPGYTPEYDNADDLPMLLLNNAGAGVWTVQQ